MEVNDCAKIVLDRIHKIEPENATKIMAYLLLKDNSEEIMSYAFGTDQQIHSLINEAKAYLASYPQYLSPQTIARPFSSPSSFRVNALHLPPPCPTDFLRSPYNDFTRMLQSQAELASFDEQLHVISPLGFRYSVYPDGSISGLRSPSNLPESRSKHCHFFYKGYCKHGNSCKYVHSLTSLDRLAYGPKEFISDDQIFYPGSLEQLEVEITELLKECKGMPVSIASLPSMYLEKYGKALQAKGYLTESQRHGKTGFSLTKLLAQLNNIRLIDRPHGQHAVVLAEDAPKYGYKDERNESGAVLPSSHQIYLTFPADSSFTDEDVSNYFEQFGPVRDVRIPHQEKRMFGFVSFYNAETVRTILAKGHPHLICGSRVLVKPYKEKTRVYDRKYIERSEFPMYYPPKLFEMEAMPRGYDNSSLLRKQLIVEEELALEHERRRILGLQLSSKPLTPRSYFNYVTRDVEMPTGNFSTLHVATSDDKRQETAKKSSEQESENIELPESPFSF